jgi:hypothetical protein
MSSQPPLQCLFCNHLNPAGASFCNDCGSQLHLQPCDHCGAINKRTAKHCYKCSAGFTLPPAPASVQIPAPELRSAPALPDDQPDYTVLNDFAITTEHTPAPESMAKHVAETEPSPRWVTVMKSRRTLRIAAAVVLLAAIVMSGDYYSEQSAEFTKTQGVIPFGPSVPGTMLSGAATAPTVATKLAVPAPVPVPVVPNAVTPKPAASPSEPGKTLSRAPPMAGPAVTARPSVASEPDVTSRQDPPVFKECPDAVAALGFCSSSSKNEGQ